MAITGKDLLEGYKASKKKNENKGNQNLLTGKDLLESHKYYKLADSVDQEYISSFVSDANNFFGNFNEGKETPSFKDATTTLQDLETRNNTIRGWLNKNKVNLDEKTYNELSNTFGQFKSGLDNLKSHYSQWDSEDSYNQWLKSEEEKQAVLGAEDFEEYKQAGINASNPTWEDTLYTNIFGWKPFGEGEKINNMVTFSEAYKNNAISASANQLRGGGSDERSAFMLLINEHMTDEEKNIYNYYIGKGETDKADKYLNNLKDTLTQRQAGAIAEKVDDNALELVFSAIAGFDQFASGVKNLDNLIMGTEADPTSAIQYAQGMTSSNNEGIWKVANDFVSTTTNMLPSIGVGVLTGGVGGAATLGASASGNAYAEMRNLGYEDWQSAGYALLVGTSEALLQAALGGITKLGGKHSISAAINNLAPKLNNALAKVAIQVPLKMGSEALEEGLQTALEPTFKALMTGEKFEGAEWEDILYSALLGGLSAGVLEGVPSVIGGAVHDANIKQHGQGLIDSGSVDALQQLALEMSGVSNDIGKLSSKVGSKTTARNVGYLSEAIGNTVNEQNMSDIQNALVEKGLSKKDAKRVSQYLFKVSQGYELSEAEAAEVENNDAIAEVWGTVLQPDSDLNKRTKKLALARMGIEYNTTSQEATEQEKIASATENTSEEISAENKAHEVSEDGKTYRISTGEEINIKRIDSVKDGKITLRLDNDETVDASDVQLGSDAEGLLYENVVRMGMSADTANAFVQAFDPNEGLSVGEYSLGFREAYRSGLFGIPTQEIPTNGFFAKLSEAKRNFAYNLGKADANKNVSAQQKAKTESIGRDFADKNASSTKKYRKYKGETHISEAKSKDFLEALTESQQNDVQAMVALQEALGINVYLFESPTDSLGRRKGKNGYYNPEDGSIHIDLFAGTQGKNTILFTAAHELTHFIREWSPAKFKVFADFLLEKYGEKGISVKGLIADKMDFLKRKGRITSEMSEAEAYDLAYEEVVADSCEAMLADGDAIAKIAELKAKDQSLWQKIKDFITNLVKKIKAYYQGIQPDSVEGRHVAEMLDSMEQLKALWTEALVDAGGTYSATEVTEGAVSENKTSEMYSFRDSKNGMANDLLSPYDEELTRFIKQRGDFIIDSFDKLTQVVNLAFDKPSLKATAYFGIINAETLDKIKNSIPNLPKATEGILFKEGRNYSIATTLDSIRHIADEKSLSRDDVVNYLDRLADTILEFDSVAFDYYTDAFKQKNSGLLFKKAFSDGVLMSFTLVSNKKRSLVLQSLYMDSADYQKKKSAETLLMPNSLSHTPKVRVGQTSDNSIPQNPNSVKRKFSDRDSLGNELSKEQQDFFKDSKVRDEQGNLLVVYHGTDADFTVFEKRNGIRNRGILGNYEVKTRGFYFSPSEEFSQDFGKTKSYYLDVKKPLIKNGDKIDLSVRDFRGRDSFHDEEIVNELYYILEPIAEEYLSYEQKVTMRLFGTSESEIKAKKRYFLDTIGISHGSIWWEIIDCDGFDESINRMVALGYDGFMCGEEGDTDSWFVLESNQAKLTTNKNPTSNPDIRYSDRDYLDAVNRGDTKTAQRMVDEAAKRAGYTIKAYHGTARGDRVGNVFLPERATSGPMAFFTDNKDIADNYARNKADTSLAYDTEYDDYYTQFRVNRNGKNISIPELWNYLSFAEKNSIKEKAKHIKFDDDYESIIVDSAAEHGNGAWDAYALNMHKGNALETLVDTWLETGDLFNREADFIKVLELVGISDVEYRDPDARYEKTYDTWLKIQKPFDTDNVNQSFYDSLSEWIDNHDMSVYEKESSNADFWDKNNQSPQSWLDKLSHDIENETTHAWTVIPDFVTDYLKQQGYDGIKDKGGKGGGAGHTVWIPFSSEQIKSAEPITYDDNGNVIPLSERFNPDNNDIRYSDRVTDQETLDFLENQEHVTVYRAMQLIDGKLYPPMNAYTRDENGKKVLVTPSEIGAWEQAVERPDLIDPKTGKFKLDKGKVDGGKRGTIIPAAYNPYIHTSLSMLNDQFTSAYQRSNLVVVKGVVPKSELTSGYHAQYAKDSVGETAWHSGVVSTKLPESRRVILSRWFKPVEVMDNDEVAKHIKKMLGNTGIEIPYNVVSPNLRRSLEKIGVPIGEGEGLANLPRKNEVKYSDRDLAPTFYSHMGKVVDEIKSEKVGAGGVVPYLKGKGVKNEEIKWSGIEAWLEGKKSVTKAELQEFIQGSQLRIEEQMSDPIPKIDIRKAGDTEYYAYALYDENGNEVDRYYYDYAGELVSEKTDESYLDVETIKAELTEDSNHTRWSQYKLDGGDNYRELVFKMPNSSYSNNAMRNHWGDEGEGVLAHARIQDFDVDGKKMLFIEEIQSDWHNEGAKDGYAEQKDEALIEKLKAKADEAFFEVEDYSVEMTGDAGEWEVIEKTEKGSKLLREYREAQATYDNAVNEIVKKVPDAPFRNNYHEYVLKRLIRMAAEEGYDSIGWTPADIQSKRWSDEFAEGYRIEYDQDIPSFLKKYGKKWGAKVGHSYLDEHGTVNKDLLVSLQKVIEEHKAELAKAKDATEAEEIRERIASVEKTIEQLSGTKIWSMEITDSMKDSVLYEGQVLYSDRDDLNQLKADLKSKYKVDPNNIIALADSYMENYGGTLNKTQFRMQFLDVAKALAEVSTTGSTEALKSADEKLAELATEIANEPKDTEEAASEIKAIRKHLKGIRIQIPKYNKGDFEQLGGFENFRKRHIGSLLLAKDGINVDALYPELQELFGTGYFPADIVNIADQLIKIAEVVDTPLSSVSEVNYDVDEAKEYIAGDLSEKIINIITRQDSRLYVTDRDTEGVSNRSLLANALESVAQNDIERRRLKEYKEKISLIESEQAKLSEIRQKLFSKGGVDPKQRKDLQFEAKQIANRINTYDRQLLNLEATAALKGVLQREKQMAYKRAEEKGREALAKYREKAQKRQDDLLKAQREKRKEAVAKVRETRDKNEAKTKLQKLVLDTAKWISYPKKDDAKCPDFLKTPYSEFLKSIDLSSKRSLEGGDATLNDIKVANAMNSLANAIEKIKMAQDPSITADNVLDSGYLDLPSDFVEKLRDMAEGVTKLMVDGDYVINKMSSAGIKQLSQLIRTLNHAIKEMSTLYSNLRFANVEALGYETMKFLDSMGELKSTNSLKEFMAWDNALPYYAFKRFGEAGESVFTELMDAQDKLANLASEIFAFKDKTWTDKEAKAWGEDVHTINLPSGNTLALTTADAMGIYCLSRREQARPHLLMGGVRVLGIKKGAKKLSDSHSSLTQEDLGAIISSLTDRQKKVAEAIQGYMSTVCSNWGNEISMKRFLTSEFTEEYYYPIESNDENLAVKDPKAQQSDLYRLLNISATKPLTPKANNEIIIRNIFDVFVEHASDMARLNAFGMPLLDYMKWINYHESILTGEDQRKDRSVRKSMRVAYEKKAEQYVIGLIKDINGRFNDNGDNKFLMNMMRMAKVASVGNNLRVVLLQITSYPRAAEVLSLGSLAKGLTKVPNINKAKKYCGIALWKSFGFYDTNIARSIEEQVKGSTNIRQKLIELSMKGAEWADAITWGALWNACEYEVAKTTKNKVGSEEFYQEVGKKLREVVYATQVVDSVLTRSQIMRSKSGLTQGATSFMSEPTLSYNILADGVFQFEKEKRITGSAKTAWRKTRKAIGRKVAIYSSVAIVAALMEGLADAWRDDEDEEFGKKFGEHFGENLISDIIPFNKIPIFSDIVNFILSRFGVGFFSEGSLEMTWLGNINDALDAWADIINEKFNEEETSTTVYSAIYKTTKALSSMLGIAVSGVMREVVALWNNTAGAYDSTLKIRGYELSNEKLGNSLFDAIVEGDTDQADSIKEEFDDEDSMESALRKTIRTKYEEGELTRDDAMKMLIEHIGMESNDAYWKMKEWDYRIANGTDEGYSKYTNFYEAVRTGKNLKAVINEYTSHGVESKTLASQITSYFKPLYVEMTNSERASIKGYLLNAYSQLGYDRDERSKSIDKWLEQD